MSTQSALLDRVLNKTNVKLIYNAHLPSSIVLSRFDNLFPHSCGSDNLFNSSVCSRLILPAPVIFRYQSSVVHNHETQLHNRFRRVCVASCLNNPIERYAIGNPNSTLA